MLDRVTGVGPAQPRNLSSRLSSLRAASGPSARRPADITARRILNDEFRVFPRSNYKPVIIICRWMDAPRMYH